MRQGELSIRLDRACGGLYADGFYMRSIYKRSLEILEHQFGIFLAAWCYVMKCIHTGMQVDCQFPPQLDERSLILPLLAHNLSVYLDGSRELCGAIQERRQLVLHDVEGLLIVYERINTILVPIHSPSARWRNSTDISAFRISFIWQHCRSRLAVNYSLYISKSRKEYRDLSI